MYVAAERLDPGADYATSICYAYARAGRTKKSNDWARRAYERKPGAVTAYNLALSVSPETEALLREALRHDPGHAPALYALGSRLRAAGNQEGFAMIERCVGALETRVNRFAATESDCRLLRVAAQEIGKTAAVELSDEYLESLNEGRPTVYREENLAASLRGPVIIEGR
jgi:molecular chaperone DnaK